MSRSLSIIVPVYNEESSIDDFYARVDRLGHADALIFVDNASTDRTLEKIEALPKGRVIRHDRNEGYGASVRDGLAASDSDDIIITDVDLEFPPEIIPELIETLEQHRVAYCSRFLGRTPRMSLVRRLGNRLISELYNLLFQQHTTDLCTGVKAMRRDAFALSELRLDGFDGAMEIAALFAISGAKIHDVAVVYEPRVRGRSKMRHVPELLRFVRHIVGFWLRCVVLGRPLHPRPSDPAEDSGH
ncbi:MAG: glycosyltransferase family 2 protein [Deltaproteobacteria bacterium]|nr:glycosyltransferase family 2 protein [Deltaproteobacteria bacterium]MBW2386235.1 glycosyltransferase family 2 protein [Deltaproteobacteria bacterium]